MTVAHGSDGDDAGSVLFTSAAYAETTDPDVEAAAADWLEAQAAHPFIVETALRSLELLALAPGESVLDAGCGTGVFLPALATAVGPAGSVTGLDFAAPFLARAEGRLAREGLRERVGLVHADARALPFEDGSFDAVHAERLLMHLDEPDEAIRELVRVTRPGGRVLCAEPYPLGVAYDHPDADVMHRLGVELVSGMRQPAMGIQLRRRFLRAGLADVRVRVVVDVETELDRDELVEFRRIGRELAERGEIDPARVETAVDAIARYDDEGTHTAIAMMFVALGRVPIADAPPAG